MILGNCFHESVAERREGGDEGLEARSSYVSADMQGVAGGIQGPFQDGRLASTEHEGDRRQHEAMADFTDGCHRT
jgi:hypothetical protein